MTDAERLTPPRRSAGAGVKASGEEMRRLQARLTRLEARHAYREGYDEMRARLEATPTVWHFTLGLIATVIAVVGLAFGLR